MLDKARQRLAVPVTVTERSDDWVVGDVTLAPLGAGDYVVEIAFTAAGGENKVVAAIRVTR
jgi:hypothetical protein